MSWLSGLGAAYGRANARSQPSYKIYGQSAAFPHSPSEGLGEQEGKVMAGLAMVLFITLFAFGGDYFGWGDSGGKVQIALVCCFIFGIICGFKVKS